MVELELKRATGDRRLYVLEGIGTLRLTGIGSRGATAEADGSRWRIERGGLWRRTVTATDETGTVVGAFAPRGMRRGGTVRWGDRELTLRPASRWREQYALLDGERELALLDGKGWGRRPVAVVVSADQVDPGLLLFTAFVVRGLAADAIAVAGGTAAATTIG